jgi:hypothetical protein
MHQPYLTGASLAAFLGATGGAAGANAAPTSAKITPGTETLSAPAAGSTTETLCSATLRWPKPTPARREQAAETTRGIGRHVNTTRYGWVEAEPRVACEASSVA